MRNRHFNSRNPLTPRGTILLALLCLAGFALIMLSCTKDASARDTYSIREGGPFGKPVATVVDNKIKRGSSRYGETLYTIDGNKIRKGSSQFGEVVATIDEDGKIREGRSRYGKVLGNTSNGTIRKGSSSFGKRVGTADEGTPDHGAAAGLLILE